MVVMMTSSQLSPIVGAPCGVGDAGRSGPGPRLMHGEQFGKEATVTRGRGGLRCSKKWSSSRSCLCPTPLVRRGPARRPQRQSLTLSAHKNKGKRSVVHLGTRTLSTRLHENVVQLHSRGMGSNSVGD